MSEEKKELFPNGNEALLKEVEEAAKRGAKAGTRGRSVMSLLRGFLIGAICGALVLTLVVMSVHKRNFTETFHALFTKEAPVEDHDMTNENHGFFGYTATDFQEAILGEQKELQKLEVYQINISEVSTITKTGLGKLKAFTKYQYVTYHGTAIYTVDLSGLKKADITLDEETRTVTLTVPDVVLEPINIPSESIEFGEVEKETVLAFGSIKLEPEEVAKLTTEAKNRMVEKLQNENAADVARTAAKHAIWEIFQPVISGVAPGYSLQVEFAEKTEPEAEAEVTLDGEPTESE
ncbi:MAG: DUF4230 domain-containing protein [Mogibacterium sp.]|nr:DUF4230 domain-containing protein [Mogibacterium sp.]